MGCVREWIAALLCPSQARLASFTRVSLSTLPQPMTFPRFLAYLSVTDTGSASGKETIEREGKAAKPADSGAVVGKGARRRGLEVRWLGPGFSPRGRRSRSKHPCEWY